jgi:signal transduction histidine kinase
LHATKAECWEKLDDPGRLEAGSVAPRDLTVGDLINDLLDLSRIRSGRLDLNPTPVELPALLQEIAAMVRVDAQKKKLAFVLDFRRRNALLHLADQHSLLERHNEAYAVQNPPQDET